MHNQYKIKTGIQYTETPFYVNCTFIGKVHMCTAHDKRSSLQNVFYVHSIDMDSTEYNSYGLPSEEQVQAIKNGEGYIFICTDAYLRKQKIDLKGINQVSDLHVQVQKYIDSRKVLNTFYKSGQDTSEIICAHNKSFSSSKIKVQEEPVQITDIMQLLSTRVVFDYKGFVCTASNPHYSCTLFYRKGNVLDIQKVRTTELYIQENECHVAFTNELKNFLEMGEILKSARYVNFSV